jgi:hypothetical protein
MKKILFLAALLLLAIPAPAPAISCVGAGDVSTLTGGCDLGPVHFGDFAVSAQGQNGFAAAVFLAGAPFTNVTAEQTSGGQANLTFQVATTQAPGLADILLSYSATALNGLPLLGGINLSNGGTGVVINERACRTPFVGSTCADGLVANILVDQQDSQAVRFSPDVDLAQVFIRKDIVFSESGFLSDFTNSHELGDIGDISPTPEPATLLQFGTVLTGRGSWSRRRRA